MQCTETRPLLADFIESNLSDEQAAAVREHVRVCASCGAELKALADVGVLLMEWRPPAPPERIWKRLEAELPAPPARRAVLYPPAFRIAVAVAATLLTGLLLWAVSAIPAIRATWSGTQAHQHLTDPQFEGTPAPPIVQPVAVPVEERTVPAKEKRAAEQTPPGQAQLSTDLGSTPPTTTGRPRPSPRVVQPRVVRP